ncbi:hypothetical protein [Terasakiella sp. SH-1]|uniref:hypothetical protein n=1 Tax=Terasakiella sp. SH-1 TaxID=2560057 RepID=UPI00107484DF|nr:hypothetical protein [Terasakiella sp. SH-1]
MYIVATVKQSGATSFEGFWDKQQASAFWSEICTRDSAKTSLDPIKELHLYTSDAGSLEGGIKLARRGELETIKQLKLDAILPLKDVVMLSGKGRVDQNTIRQADQNLHAQSDDFLTICTERLQELARYLENFTQKGIQSDDELAAFKDLIYDIRVMGGSFNYPLLSVIGEHCEKYLLKKEKKGPLRPQDFKTLTAYFSALTFIADEKVQGPGGNLGKQVVSRLTDVIQKRTGRFVPPAQKEKTTKEAGVISQEALNSLLNKTTH